MLRMMLWWREPFGCILNSIWMQEALLCCHQSQYPWLIDLGIGFFRGYRCKAGLAMILWIRFGNIYAHMQSYANASIFHIGQLVVRKKLSLPPNSVAYVDAKLESPTNVPFAFEPAYDLAQQKLFMMPGMIQGEQTIQIAVLNLADIHVKLRHNQEMVHTIEVDAMLDVKAEKDEKLVLYAGKDDRGGCQFLNGINIPISGHISWTSQCYCGGGWAGCLGDCDRLGHQVCRWLIKELPSPQDVPAAQHLSHMIERISYLNIRKQRTRMLRKGTAQSKRRSCALSSCLLMCLWKTISISLSSQLLWMELESVNLSLFKQDWDGLHSNLNRQSERPWIQC